MRKKGFSIILIILGIFLLIIAALFLFGYFYFTGKYTNPRNKPNALISDLKWEKGPYEIYYVNKHGLHLRKTDGSNYKLIKEANENLWNYALLTNTKQILIYYDKSILFTDKFGNNPKQILELQPDKFLKEWSLSPNYQLLALEVAARKLHDSTGKQILHDLYIFDFRNNQIKLIDKNIYSMLNNIVFYWCDNNTVLKIKGTKTYTPNDVREQEYELDLFSSKITLLSERPWGKSIYEQQSPSFTVSVFNNPTCSPVANPISKNTSPVDSSISPDGTKKSQAKYGSLFVNDQEIVHWYGYDGKFSPGYYGHKWFPDNGHIAAQGNGIIIIEVGTKKYAKLDDGWDVKWFPI